MKRTIQAVRQAERAPEFPWEEVFASMGDGVLVTDSDRRLVRINPEGERLLGLSAEASLGFLIDEIFPSEAWLRVAAAFEEFRTWTLREVSWQNGRGPVHVDLSISPLVGREGEGLGWIVILRDQTAVRSLEEEIRRADRLAQLGTIAAGLAHEIKNPLGGIKGAAQLMEREGRLSRDYLEIIVRESERVDRLVTDLLSFARPRSLDKTSCNLNELLNGILLLEQPALKGGDILVTREFDPSLPAVLGDRGQLTQVFLNIVKNAREAMPSGGTLRIRTRFETDYRIVDQEEGKGYRRVVVQVEDAGLGMAPDQLEKIFTPFFSTKESGNGLGMAIAQRIILEHQGAIRVTSEEGKGTLVQVFLRSVV